MSGSTLRTPHMDGGRIRAYVGRRRRVKGAVILEKIAREELPVEIQTGGDLES